MIVDAAFIHEFCGNHLADVSRNGQLRDPDVDRLLEKAARTKVARYRDAYANRPGTTFAFLPCAMSASGRIHGELLRRLSSLPTGAPDGTLPTWGMKSKEVKPSPGAELNSTGIIKPPSALRMLSPSPAALTSRTPPSPPVGLPPLQATLSPSFTPLPLMDTFGVDSARCTSGLLCSLSKMGGFSIPRSTQISLRPCRESIKPCHNPICSGYRECD